MKAKIELNKVVYETNFSEPIDISTPMIASENSVSAWHVGPIKITPVMNDKFIGSVEKGGAVNFNNIFFNPHGNGTHTECVGHISKEFCSINQELKKFLFTSNLISIEPLILENGDSVITDEQLENHLCKLKKADALIIRTLPNSESKLVKNYSNSNPTYLQANCIAILLKYGIEHLLIDLPSIDREEDEGKLSAHHLFWEYPKNVQKQRTITELVFVPSNVEDGFYLLNIQIAPFENDASPSKPVLYKLSE